MNNKGFAFSTMLYGFMIIGCLIFLIILGLMSTNRTNTREIVNLIEDESRLSEANQTFTTKDQGKDYAEYYVPLGFGGWFKIELWGKGKYSARTVYLQELTKIRFFIGTGSADTYACSSNVWSGSGPNASGYVDEGAFANNIKQIETVSECTSNNGLIFSTSSNSTVDIKQVADERGSNGSNIVVITYPIKNSGTQVNYVSGITSSLNKARINLVSNSPANFTFPTASGCSARHSGIYYIKNGTNFATYGSSSVSYSAFTGDRKQKWLVQCTTASSCKAKSLSELAYEIPSFSCNNGNLVPAGY